MAEHTYTYLGTTAFARVRVCDEVPAAFHGRQSGELGTDGERAMGQIKRDGRKQLKKQQRVWTAGMLRKSLPP